MSLIFPNTRLTRDDVECPMFVSDINNATESVRLMAKAALGVGDSDFYIISGCEYLGQGGYTAGIIYLNGYFYNAEAIAPGTYYNPLQTDVQSKLHKDSNQYMTYREYTAVESAISVSGGSPQMSGNMNIYRIGNKYMKGVIKEDQSTSFSTATAETGFNTSIQYRKDCNGSLEVVGSFNCTDVSKLTVTILGFQPSVEQRFLIGWAYLTNYDSVMVTLQTNGELKFLNKAPVNTGTYYISQKIIM